MFIHSSPALRPEHDYELILERALNTYVLGEHVAPKWQIGKVLKWRPMNVGNMSKPLGPNVEVPSPLMNLEPDNARSVGMYKVHGTTVEALVGGVFHQFVSQTSSSLFSLCSRSASSLRVVLLRTACSTLEYFRTSCYKAATKDCMLHTTTMLGRFARRWAAPKDLCFDRGLVRGP